MGLLGTIITQGVLIIACPSNHGFPGAQDLAHVCGVNHLGL